MQAVCKNGKRALSTLQEQQHQTFIANTVYQINDAWNIPTNKARKTCKNKSTVERFIVIIIKARRSSP